MPSGTPILRQWILVLHNGVIVVDWGDGYYQDVDSGEFLKIGESDISRTVQTDELETLKRSSRINDYDEVQVWLNVLPERPIRGLD
jgi:hypothetical protein